MEITQATINIISIAIAIFIIVGASFYFYYKRKKAQKFKAVEAKNKESLNDKYSYRVTIADGFGESYREVATFGAEKLRNAENILELVNDDKKFREFFPYDNSNFDYSLEFAQGRLNKARNAARDNTKQNPYDLRAEVYKWEKIVHSLKNGSSEFLKFDKDGTPHILFIRHGSVNVPYKQNIKKGHLQAPSDPFIKDVIASREDKRKKYLEKNLRFREIIVTIGLFIMLAMVIANGIWSYTNAKFDDTDISAMQERIDNAPLLCAEYLGVASDNFLEASENSLKASRTSVNITESAASWVGKKIEPSVPVTDVK